MSTLAAVVLAAQLQTATPLLDYARTLSFDTAPNEPQSRLELAHAERELADHPPPADCAQTLGASRFAALLHRLARQRAWLGDHDGAIDAYTRALACRPRAPYLNAELAEELANAGRYAQAQSIVTRGLALERTDYDLGALQGRLDFIAERWADAIAWLRWTASAAPDARQKRYAQCLLWLAEQRSGLPHPAPAAPVGGEAWPAPILEALAGVSGESNLLSAIREQSVELTRREQLVEALFYMGERRLADGDVASARRYFAATVNLKVIYYIEHDLALAELAKLRAASGPQP